MKILRLDGTWDSRTLIQGTRYKGVRPKGSQFQVLSGVVRTAAGEPHISICGLGFLVYDLELKGSLLRIFVRRNLYKRI